MNNEFKNYVTSASFSLTLSKTQIHNLCLHYACNEGNKPVQTIYDRTYNSLITKGLIESVGETEDSHGFTYSLLRLTKAGQLTIELLKEADLFVPHGWARTENTEETELEINLK